MYIQGFGSRPRTVQDDGDCGHDAVGEAAVVRLRGRVIGRDHNLQAKTVRSGELLQHLHGTKARSAAARSVWPIKAPLRHSFLGSNRCIGLLGMQVIACKGR